MRHHRLLAPLIVALALLPITACSSSGNGTSTVAPGYPGDSGMDIGAPEPTPDMPGVGEAAGGGTDGAVSNERSVIETGSLSVSVDDPAAATSQAGAIARELGGYVANQEVFSEASGMAHLQLRVPSTELDTAFTRVGELGDVTAQSRAARDVTAERVDLQARVQALDTAVTRLRTLMAKAETTTDLLAAESALSARQQELDGLRAQLAYLSDQVSQATLDVTLTAQRPLPGGGPSNFWEGLNSGWNSMLAAASGAIVVLGIILPWLALAGIVVALAIWLVRRRHRRTLREEPHERVS